MWRPTGPIAAGLVSVPAALTAAAVLAVVSLSLATWSTPALAGVVLLYGLIQVGYCFQLKRMPLLDLFCIASGFLLRAIAGVVAGGFVFSPWFLLTVGLLALFLAIEKRKAELRTLVLLPARCWSATRCLCCCASRAWSPLVPS